MSVAAERDAARKDRTAAVERLNAIASELVVSDEKNMHLRSSELRLEKALQTSREELDSLKLQYEVSNPTFEWSFGL